jgi:hypothetical protein
MGQSRTTKPQTRDSRGDSNSGVQEVPSGGGAKFGSFSERSGSEPINAPLEGCAADLSLEPGGWKSEPLRGFSGPRFPRLDSRCVTPKRFQIVTLSYIDAHDVDDDIEEIENHPGSV